MRVLPVLLALVAARPAMAQEAQADDVPPAGFGTLHREDVEFRLQTGDLQITVLPLDERVIRLLAPDSYAALSGLKRLKADAVAEAVRRYALRTARLFIVTFYGLRERTPFVPEDVTIQSRGLFFRPVAIVPLTPRWSEQQLAQRETAIAVYLYDEGIEVLEPFAVSYAGQSSGGWERILRRLDQERAAVLSRAAAAGHR